MKKSSIKDELSEYVDSLDNKRFIKTLKDDLRYAIEHYDESKLKSILVDAQHLGQELNKGRYQEQNELICFIMLTMFLEK